MIIEDGLLDRVNCALANLPPYAQLVFSLRLDDANWNEIAGEVGCSEEDARDIYELTCRALREELDEDVDASQS